MRRIFWDTMLFVYWFEGTAKEASRVKHIREAMLGAGDELCANLFVLSELLVGPTRTQNQAGIRAIENFFSSPHVTLLPYTFDVSRRFAMIRSSGVKALDALHLATASHSGVDLFLTNDRKLQNLTIPGIKFIASMDTDLF